MKNNNIRLKTGTTAPSDKRYAYYQTLYGRNVLNSQVLPAFIIWLCLPKIVVEVFVRRRMGERYFSLVWAIVAGVILYMLPKYMQQIYGHSVGFFYYVFLTGYAIMTVVSFIEILRAPSVFDLARFSLDTGEALPFFHRIKILGKTPTQRTIDVYLEPLFCFLIGAVISFIFRQPLTGLVIMFCSLCHFVSSLAFAIRGDHATMDIIDGIIFNEGVTETFAQDKEVSSKGVTFYPQKPSSAELRGKLGDFLTGRRDPDDDDEGMAPVS